VEERDKTTKINQPGVEARPAVDSIGGGRRQLRARHQTDFELTAPSAERQQSQPKSPQPQEVKVKLGRGRKVVVEDAGRGRAAIAPRKTQYPLLPATVPKQHD
jgi:hypothetical protein